MAKEEKGTQGQVIGQLSPSTISLFHGVTVWCGFIGALYLGCTYHYNKIVKNEFFGYPDEWFPSISATIGDWAPERTFFQLAMALASGPRFLMAFFTYFFIKARIEESSLNSFLFFVILSRAFLAGGWIFITSSDDHLLHDVAMILYLIFSLVYYILSTYLLARAKQQVGLKSFLILLFGLDLIPIVYFFLQHKQEKVPGAYTIYAFFEWSLILIDVGFDTTTYYDFSSLTLQVYDSKAEKKEKTESSVSIFSFLSYFVDIFLGFMSWSLITGLFLCVWFFPLFEMEISGYEVALIGICSPIFLGFSFVRKFVQNQRWLFLILSLVGILSYLQPHPSKRLGIVGLGVAIDTMLVSSLWWTNRRSHAIITHLLGLVLFLIVKVVYITNNPVWPAMNHTNGGLNLEAVFATVLCALIVLFRGDNVADNSKKISETSSFGWFLSSIAFSSILFLTHLLFTDYSVVSNWVVVGYPDPGPLPYPWGICVVLSVIVGLNISTQSWVSSLVWWLVGLAGSVLLYYGPTYIGFAGGNILAIYVFSIWPAVVNKMAAFPPGRTLFLAYFLTIIWLLGSVWVVAYPFVPGGDYLRERTHILLFGAMIGILFGVWKAKPLFSDIAEKEKKIAKKHLSMATLVLVTLLAIASSQRKLSPNPAPPAPTGTEKVLTTAVWTIHFGYDEHLWLSNYRMSYLLKTVDADLISLLETDSSRPYMGNRDIIQWLADDLNLYYDYGPATRNHTWGCALLSRYPIIKSQHYLLPSPEGELACAIHATVNVSGTAIDFLVGHNGNEQHVIDRRLQTQVISGILRDATNPIVFAGYVVTEPKSDNYNILVRDSGSKDIDPTDTDRWCQYLVYKGLEKVGYARISHGGITDTELQAGKFLIGTGKDNVDEVEESKVPSYRRFSAAFKGRGTKGHRFHVFDRPKYFGKAQ